MQLPRRTFRILTLIVFTVSTATLARAQKPKKIQAGFDDATVDTVRRDSIQILYTDVTSTDNAAIVKAVPSISSWTILIDGKVKDVDVQSAAVQSVGLIVLTLDQPLDAKTLADHHLTVIFAGDPAGGVLPETVAVKQPKTVPSSGWHVPKLNFTRSKTDANLDVSGNLQTGVGATPQYEWNVLAKYPFERNGTSFVFKGGPQFTGSASQQTNADPDSLSASAATEFDFPEVHAGSLSLPINLLFDPISYEFERKPEQAAVLTNGKATLNNYLQKNTNLIVSGGVQFVISPDGKRKWAPPNLNINLGTELGSALSRSVLNVNPKPGYSDNPLRAVAGADIYFAVPPRPNVKQQLFTVDGHYTVRSPFHPEPFKQAGVNGGNEFYSTKARHYIAVNLTRALAKGANLTVQYKFGSLPPTFNFVDHQVTIGFEVVLGKTGGK